MRLLRAALDSMAASLELRAAEVRTGTTLIEAVAADRFNTELRMLTGTEAGRDDLREATILVAKMGLTSEDIEPMARNYHMGGIQLRRFADTLSRYADELTPGGNA